MSEPIEKKTGEGFPIGFQFYGELPPGVTKLTAASAKARNVTTSTDPDNAVLESTAGVIQNGTLAVVGLKPGGTVGHEFEVECTARWDDDPDHVLIERRIVKITQ